MRTRSGHTFQVFWPGLQDSHHLDFSVQPPFAVWVPFSQKSVAEFGLWGRFLVTSWWGSPALLSISLSLSPFCINVEKESSWMLASTLASCHTWTVSFGDPPGLINLKSDEIRFLCDTGLSENSCCDNGVALLFLKDIEQMHKDGVPIAIGALVGSSLPWPKELVCDKSRHLVVGVKDWAWAACMSELT